jgi:hypothetical protein
VSGRGDGVGGGGDVDARENFELKLHYVSQRQDEGAMATRIPVATNNQHSKAIIKLRNRIRKR